MRLTTAQATIKFLSQQFVERDQKQYKFINGVWGIFGHGNVCLLYTSPSPRDATLSRMPSSA